MDYNSKEKLKVCWLLTGSEAYGRGTLICQILRRLAMRSDMSLIVIATCEGKYLEQLSGSNLVINRLGFGPIRFLKSLSGRRSIWRIFREFIHQIRIVFSVGRLLLKHRCDIIHSHGPHMHIVAAVLSYFIKIKVVWHWHGAYVYDGLPHLLFRALRKRTTKSISISQFVKTSLPQRFQQDNCVIHNGIDLQVNHKYRGGDFRKLYSIREDMYLVGAFGTIAPIKGLGYFIEAIPAILKAQPKTCFPIVGGTSSPQSKVELERIKRMIQDLDISEYVILTGMIPDASRYMADFDVIVVPSIPPGEGFGMVVVESMAAVVPPIVTSYGAFPEIVEDGLSGLIVQPKSSTEIAEAVVKLLDNEAIRKEMGQAARERVERFFSIERVADDIQKFYKEL